VAATCSPCAPTARSGPGAPTPTGSWRRDHDRSGFPVLVEGNPDNFLFLKQVAAGDTHSAARRTDGYFFTWGNNASGQLGDNTLVSKSVPTETVFSGPAIAAGRDFTVAIGSGPHGYLWAWGANAHGQLGDGTTTFHKQPLQVAGISGVTQVAAGNQHVVALRNDNTVWAWGHNAFGQLGDGSRMDRLLPALVPGVNGAIGIGAGGDHSLAFLVDRTARSWGRNSTGQLGDGTATDRATAVAVSGLAAVTALAAGGSHSMALSGDGGVRSWGDNFDGQLGAPSVDGSARSSCGERARAARERSTSTSPRTAFASVTNAPLASLQLSNTGALQCRRARQRDLDRRRRVPIDAGAFTALPGTINPSQTVTLRLATSSDCGTLTTATVTVAGHAMTFNATTVACDHQPDSFTFTPIGNLPLGSTRVSNTVTITGINAPTKVDVLGGEFSIGCDGNFTSAQRSSRTARRCARAARRTRASTGIRSKFRSTSMARFRSRSGSPTRRRPEFP
jgi:hypothetical protein